MRELVERLESLIEGKSSRIPKYGEVYRKKHGDHTIVVRGIFRQRKGDQYHVRVLRGDGKESDETKRGNVLWRTDLQAGDYETPDAAVKAAVKAAARGYGLSG